MLGRASSPPRVATLVALTAISTLSLNMFLPSLVDMADDFGAPYAQISLSIAGYLAVTSVLQLVIGPMSDRFGRRPVILVAMAVFLLASLGCLLAQSIEVFLTFRMLQGAVIAGAALSPAIVRDTLPVRQAASMLGYIAMAMAIVPMLGPVLGGALDQLFGWRSSFLVFAVAGAGLVGLVWTDLGETNASPNPEFSQQFRAYAPLLRSGQFWGYASCMAFSTGGFYIFLAGAPLVSRTLFATSAGALGVYIGSITAGFFMGSLISGRLASRVSLGFMMLVGRIVAGAGPSVGIALFWAGYMHELTLFGATIFVGIGNGITMPSSSAGVMSINPKLAGTASGLAGALTVGMGAVLTTISGIVVTAHTSASALLGLMLASSVLGLLAALWTLRSGQSEPEAN